MACIKFCSRVVGEAIKKIRTEIFITENRYFGEHYFIAGQLRSSSSHPESNLFTLFSDLIGSIKIRLLLDRDGWKIRHSFVPETPGAVTFLEKFNVGPIRRPSRDVMRGIILVELFRYRHVSINGVDNGMEAKNKRTTASRESIFRDSRQAPKLGQNCM